MQCGGLPEMGLNAPKTEDNTVLWFHPVAETPVPSELQEQSSFDPGAGFSLKPGEEHGSPG